MYWIFFYVKSSYYKKFDKIICNSKYMSDYLRKKYNFKSEVVFPPSIIYQPKIKIKDTKIKKNLRIKK